MFKKAIGEWRVFREVEPGHRFQTRYNNHRQRRLRSETSSYTRILNLVGGSALVVAGFAFIPTLGPSYMIIVLGMWMLSGELLPLARLFDRLDVRLRRPGRWVSERWTWPTPAKVLVVLACAAALGYGIYRLVSGG